LILKSKGMNQLPGEGWAFAAVGTNAQSTTPKPAPDVQTFEVGNARTNKRGGELGEPGDREALALTSVKRTGQQ